MLQGNPSQTSVAARSLSTDFLFQNSIFTTQGTSKETSLRVLKNKKTINGDGVDGMKQKISLEKQKFTRKQLWAVPLRRCALQFPDAQLGPASHAPFQLPLSQQQTPA